MGVDLDHPLLGHVLDPTLAESTEDALRDLLRDRNRRRHRTDDADLCICPDSSLHEVIVQQERPFERGRRALEGLTEDPDQDRPRVEVGQHVAHSLCPRDRVVLGPALLESGRGREVVFRPQSDGQDVGVVGTVVGRHSSFLRVDRRHPFLPELDSFLGNVAVAHQHVGCGLAAKQNVQLREAEAERVVPVDERHANVVRKRVGQARRQLQAPETSSKDHDVLLHRQADDNPEALVTRLPASRAFSTTRSAPATR